MRKLLMAVYIIFFCRVGIAQGMQGEELPGEIKHTQAYERLLSELSKDYLFEEKKVPWGMGYNFDPAEKLISDARVGQIKKTVEEYGAKKIILPKKKRPLLYKPSNTNIFCENCDPVEIIKTYIRNVKHQNLKDNVLLSCELIDHCIKDSKHRELSLITFLKLARKFYCQRKHRRVIFAILDGHLRLRKTLNDKSQMFIYKAIGNARFLRDLLDYNIQISDLDGYREKELQKELASYAVKCRYSSIAALMLLKEHGIDFGDSKLIDLALDKKSIKCSKRYNKSDGKSLTCLSFLLDQQINISPQNIEQRINWAFSEYKGSYALETYKAMLRFRLIKSIRPLEKIIIDKLKQDECKKKYDNLQNLFVKNDKLFNRTEVQALINKFLEVQKDCDLLHKLIADIETKQNAEGFLGNIKKLEVSRFLSQLITGLDIGVSCLGTLFCTGSLQKLAIGYMAIRAYSSALGVSFLKGKLGELHDWATKETSKQLQMNYFKGYLQGLQIKSDAQKATNWQYYEKNFEKLSSLKKISCQYFLSALIPLAIVCISESENIMWKSLGLTGMCFWGIGRSVINRLTELDEKNVQQLLDDFFNRGNQAGCARITGEQLQLPEEEIEKPETSFFKTLFGGIATHSRSFLQWIQNLKYVNLRKNNAGI